MARKIHQAPAYVTTIQGGYNAAAPGGDQAYKNALFDGGFTTTYQGDSKPNSARDSGLYAREVQKRYQGGQAVDPRALAQAAQDRAQAANNQQVGAQRGSGGQSQGLRAAMMGTNQASAAGTQAQMQSTQEQAAQRTAILQQKMAQEQQHLRAVADFQEEKDRFKKEEGENNADTSSGMLKLASAGFSAMSDERTKRPAKRSKAPKLVIMLGGH
jgi:hypothetical protein